MEDIRIKRLENLKDTMLINHLAEIDIDNRLDFYDTMLYKTFSGEFDDSFLSDNLDNLDNEKRNEILALAKKYSSLCFYLGESYNWLDSIEGVTLSDLDLVSIKLLDNYDYLIRLAKNGGEDVLKFLCKFQGTELFKKGAIIAGLRNSFYSDDVLEKILIEMSRKDGNYKDFTDSQKLVLCNYPNGVLYEVSEDEPFEMSDTKLLKMKITKKFIGSFDFDVSDIELSSFEDIVSSIYTDYNKNIYGNYK